MAELHLQLLGNFCLTYDGKPVTAIDTPRLCALVAYLALHRHAPQPRHHLAFLFWPDSSEAQALTNLRKQLLYLRNAWPDAERFIDISRQTIRWRGIDEFRFDVAQFEAALSQAEATTDEQAIHLLRCAISLYRGDLLPECYDDWIFPIRETLRAQYRRGLERLVQLLEEHRDYTMAVDYAQQLLRHDPLHEPTYRQLMRLYALNSDRAMALRIYHTCITQLREELGVDPGAETQAAYEQLLHHQPSVQTNQATEPALPFVGRQAEWQMLQQSWRKSMHGQAHFVLIAGEAGIGKTRLAEALLDWARHQGIATARTRSYAAEGRVAYAPIVEWLRTDLLFPHLQRLDDVWLTELGRLLPEIFTIYPHVPRPDAVTQSWQRGQLFAALARAIHIVQRPLVLLLDDLQWCDQETLEWLHFLLRFNANGKGNPAQLLIVGTARLPDEVDARHPLRALLHELQQTGQLTHLDLQRLTRIETTDLANRMSRQALDNAAIVQLYADTEGNPLFVVETVRAKLPGQSSPTTAHHLTTIPAEKSNPSLSNAILPPKVYSVIQARLAQLSPAAQEVAEVAAVIGRQFTLDLLLLAAGKTEEVVVTALDELWLRRIVREQGVQAYDFSHDKIREVVYAESRSARRRLLHHRVAEALETLHADKVADVATQLAAHFEQAGLVQKAIEFYQMAAEVALRVYANHEAIDHLQQALALLGRLPIGQARDRQEIGLQLLLTVPLMTVKYYHTLEVETAYQRAYLLSTQLGEGTHPTILRGLAGTALLHGKHRQTEHWANQMLMLAQQIGQPIYIVEAHYLLGVNCFWLGNFDLSLQHLSAALAHFDAQQQWEHIIRYAQDPKSICQQRLGYTLWHLGYPTRANHTIDVAINYAQELAHPFSLGYILTFALVASIDSGNLNRAQLLAERGGLFLEQHDFPHWQSIAAILRSYLMTTQGQVYQGIAQMRDALAIYYDRGSRNMWPFFLGLLARSYNMVNEVEQGLTILAEAIKAVEQQDERSNEVELYRLKGVLLHTQGAAPAVIEAQFQQALAIARRQNAKSLELRTAMNLSRLWAEQDKRSEARQILVPIYRWFTEGFDTPDLVEAKALLDSLP